MRTTLNGAVREILRVGEPFIVMPVGVPGCGKTTFIRALTLALAQTQKLAVVASTDDMLDHAAKQLGISYKESFDRFMKGYNKSFKLLIENTLTATQNLIIDRTQVGRKARREHLEKVPANYTRIAVTFEVSDAVLNKRLADRAAATGKDIPAFVMASMTKRYEAPSKAEGFDLIINVENENERSQGT